MKSIIILMLVIMTGCDTNPVSPITLDHQVVKADTLHHPCYDVMYKYRCKYVVLTHPRK